MKTRATASRKTAVPRARAQRAASKPNFFSHDDPNGSYTGVPADGGRPVQDADDL